jgi:isocitrate lyase
MSYQDTIAKAGSLITSNGAPWDGISAESTARMKLQNRFNTGLDIAKYTAKIMRADMAAYDLPSTNSVAQPHVAAHHQPPSRSTPLNKEGLSWHG